jgi:hypothetical protein
MVQPDCDTQVLLEDYTTKSCTAKTATLKGSLMAFVIEARQLTDGNQ